MKVKPLILILFLSVILLQTSGRLCGEKGGLSVMLPHVEVISGGHCESSAILNALHYLKYEMNEAVVAGGGGAPSFMYQKGNFPFLGGRCGNLREVFFKGAGIPWHLKRPENPAAPWKDLFTLLEQGIPVILRVDMRYLPYLYGGQYGPAYMSFGWHMITLFGINAEKKVAYVSDTALKGLQEIKLEHLERARFSDTKIFPPHGEYYWIEKKPRGYQLDWEKLLFNALKNVVTNMEQTHPPALSGLSGEMGLFGLKNLGNNIMAIEETAQNPFMVPMILNFWYGCIETNGTGGAAFRILFRDFLKQAGEKLSKMKLDKAMESVDNSIEAWHQLASGFKTLAAKIGGMGDKEMRKKQYRRLADIADELYKKEKRFYEVLKTMIER